MKIIAFNGSPRKKRNTATLLQSALEGAASRGAETEIVDLYDIDYKGCISCYACKKIEKPTFGHCAVKDDLAPVLQKAVEADGLIFGTPIYYGAQSGMLRCFLERLLYPLYPLAPDKETLFPRTIPTAFFYTMGVSEEMAREQGYTQVIGLAETWLKRLFGGPSETLLATGTLHVDDYTPFGPVYIDVADRKRRHAEVFPEDCRKAFAIGARMADAAKG